MHLEKTPKRPHEALKALESAIAAILLVFLCPPGVITSAAEPDAKTEEARTNEPDVRLTSLKTVIAGTSENLRLDPESETIELGDSRFNLADVLVIDFARPEARPPASGPGMLLVLGGGEEILVSPRGGDEDEIRFHHPEVESANKIELERLSAVVFPDRFRSASHLLAFKRSLPGWGKAPITVTEKAWSTANPAADATEGNVNATPTANDGKNDGVGEDEDDIVITAEGSELRGIVESFGRTTVRFEAKSIGPVELAFERIRALRIAQLEDTSRPVRDQIEFAVTLVDGSFLRGRPLTLESGVVGIHSRALGPIKVPLPTVRHIEISGGQFQFLSDLDPVATQTRDLFAHHPVQRDVSYRGGPLRLRGRTYRKGLGMRSHARLDYALDGKYARFQAVVGIDDEARVTTLEARRSGGGMALFKVLVDDRVVFDKQLSVRDKPHTIDIPVDGGQILGIEVDHGPGLYILDYADWVDAKLIKKSELIKK